MSRSGQLFVAQTWGTGFTLYAVMKVLGIPLSKEQEKFQAYLEAHYPAIVERGIDVQQATLQNDSQDNQGE